MGKKTKKIRKLMSELEKYANEEIKKTGDDQLAMFSKGYGNGARNVIDQVRAILDEEKPKG